MRNIVLVGFMGTGKTTVAKALAKKLNMKYISTDDLIEKKERASINEVFSKKGEKYFRMVEKDIVKSVSSMENAVIDAGGGVVIDSENVENLRKSGKIFCLWAEPEVILERTKKYSHRPLLSVENPLAKIKGLLQERKPFYERADCHIRTSDMPVDEIVHTIERVMQNAKTSK